MARRRTATTDSLDMLLDTMCNAFGGIVMIAILVAILARESKIDEQRQQGELQKAKMTDREGRKMQKDIEDLENRNADIEKELLGYSQIEEMTDKYDDLTTALAQAEEEVENLTRKIAEESGKMQSERSDRMREMNEQLAQAEKTAAESQKEIADLEKQRQELTRAIEELAEQTKDSIASHKRELRPPKLQDTPRSPFNFILRYGEIFPVAKLTVDAGGNVLDIDEKNPDTINWQGSMAIPQQGKGLKMSERANEIRGILESILRFNGKNVADPGAQIYAVGQVYRDSFGTFVEFHKLVREMGVPNGWEPIDSTENLSFGASGNKPQQE